MADKPKFVTCLWFHSAEDCEAAVDFYVATFPDATRGQRTDSAVDSPASPAGTLLTLEFSIAGMAFFALNGGPHFTFNESVSFQILTEDQAETNRLWDAIVGNDGAESQCGWCKDKWGVSWQITPRILMDYERDADRERSARAMQAMFAMTKIDIAAIVAAAEGTGA